MTLPESPPPDEGVPTPPPRKRKYKVKKKARKPRPLPPRYVIKVPRLPPVEGMKLARRDSITLKSVVDSLMDLQLARQAAVAHLLHALQIRTLPEELRVAEERGGDEEGCIYSAKEAATISLTSPLAKSIVESTLLSQNQDSITVIATSASGAKLNPLEKLRALISSTPKPHEEMIDATFTQ